jgi:pimeloyl-ACP methyl ester carboxylesterase
MTSFLGEQSITTFSLVGFSMGGKFALATFEAFPAQCKNIFLIAPDGIKTSFWYSMATYPLLLRRFFKSLIGNYNRFEALTKFLHKYRLVDQGLIRFADYQMGSEHKRKRVYYSWVVFRHLKFNMKSIARLINQHKVNAVIIVGEYDRVIEPKNMTRFLQHLDRYRFEVLPSGHSGLIYQSLPFIKEQL